MATSEGGQPPVAEPEVDQPPANPETDADCVITTVVSGSDSSMFDSIPPMDLGHGPSSVADLPQDLLWLTGEVNATRKAAQLHAEQLAAIDGRLASLEVVPANVEALSRVTRQELERCANVLFGHDRALSEARDRLERLTATVGGLHGVPAPGQTAPAPASDEALARIVEQVDALNQRVVAMESRVEPLEPVPTVVQALRRAVRASDDLLAGEVSAREAQVAALAGEVEAHAQAREDAMRRQVAQDLERVAGRATAQAEIIEALVSRVAAAEARLAPLDSAPSDIEALGRILRRELDALTTDAQARDQMLRRALQNEIDQLQAASAAREALAAEAATRLEAVEAKVADMAEAQNAAATASSERLAALDSRVAMADGLGAQLEALKEVVRGELEQLRTDAKAHDQVMGEITRKFAALDGRIARFDPVPGELQSLRTALRQDAERAVNQLRTLEERLDQLAWVPGEFQEARKRILALGSGLQADQDSVRSLEAAVAATNDRVKALGARLGPPAAPGPPA
jgi:DNA repair exonuclease SbcCD ATPase subunit